MDEVINAGDTDVIDEHFAPELAPRMRRVFSSFRSAFPDWREEIVELVADGDLVAGRFKCRGTHRGEFLGVAPTGRRQEVDEVFFLRVEGGRFVSFLALEDNHARSRQLDLTGRQSEGPCGRPVRDRARRPAHDARPGARRVRGGGGRARSDRRGGRAHRAVRVPVGHVNFGVESVEAAAAYKKRFEARGS